MKRVITARDEAGRSSIVDDGAPGTVVRFGPGFEVHELWRIDEAPTSVNAGSDPEKYSFEPAQGAVFRAVVIPPDVEVQRSLERGDKWGANTPYRATGDDYGLHGTETIDFVSVVSGRVAVQMPDGSRSELGPGDAVVQRGAVHSWRNAGPEPVVLHVAMIGTRHPSSGE
jgi:mannose-6-phosphate isomerase-like protein (cupin superfamily)